MRIGDTHQMMSISKMNDCYCFIKYENCVISIEVNLKTQFKPNPIDNSEIFYKNFRII